MEIKLTQGYVALVDDADYDYINQFKWCVYIDRKKNLYYAIGSKKVNGVRKSIRMHREIMQPPKNMVVDHINGDGLDNRRINLRICTVQQNACNRTSNRDSTSKYLGVSWYKALSKWQSVINPDGKIKHLGYFNTELEAAIIYNINARKYFGEFANPNKLNH